MNLQNQDIEKALTGTLENIKNKILEDDDKVIEQNLIPDFNKLQLDDQQLFINYVQKNYSQYNFIKDSRFKNQQQFQNEKEIVDNQKELFQQLVQQKQQEFETLPRLTIEQSISNAQVLSKSIKQSFLDKFYSDQLDKVKLSIQKNNMKCDDYVRRLDQRLLENYQQAKQNNIKDQEILDYILDQKGYIEKSVDQLIKEKEQELQKEYEPKLRQELNVFLKQVFNNIEIIYNRTKQQNVVLKSEDYFQINENDQKQKEDQDYDSLLFQLICQCIQGKQLTNEQLQNISKEQQEVFQQNYKSINNLIFEKILNDQQKRIPALKLFIEELYKKIDEEIQNSSKEPVNLQQLNTQEHFNKVKLSLVGCQSICPFCKRKCDQQPDSNHKHFCSNGHYLIGMTGVLLDNNYPLLDSCEEINNSCQIQRSQQSNFQYWHEVIRKDFDGWNYQQWCVDNLFDHRVIQQRDKMINIWNNGVGELLCQHFSQKVQQRIYFQKKNRLRYRSIHYILMLDDSGSMGGQQWENAKNGALQCMQDMGRNEEARVSVIIFNNDARVVINCEKVDINKQKDLITFKSGGTSFNNAFLKAYDQLQNHVNKQFDKIIILFYTDGGDSYPADAVNKFCQLPHDIRRTIQLFSCAEGSQNASLVQLTDNLNKSGISAELKSNIYVHDLQRVWAEVVNQNYNQIKFWNIIK